MTATKLQFQRLCLLLIITWFICGLFATLAGLTGFFYFPLGLLLLLPSIILIVQVFEIQKKVHAFTYFEKIVCALILTWWILHLFQVFTPETGFDAVWYHLPLAEQTVDYYRFITSIHFYQSFNPQFSDGIFYLGYMILGELGAKLVAYGFGISTVLISYALSRVVLDRKWSLISVLLISGFQVISWQSSSFYVDLSKAFWEVAALWLLLSKKSYKLAGLALGASLATKLFSITLLPIFAAITWLLYRSKVTLLFILLALLVAMPYYGLANSVSNNPFYSLTHHVNKIDEISSSENGVQYLLRKTLYLPLSPYDFLLTREYTTPLLLLIFPLVWLYRSKVKAVKSLLILAVFAAFQFLVWWYVPPTSIRYALSGFIVATIVTVYLIREYVEEYHVSLQNTFMILLILGVIFMPIRIWVAARSAVYIFGLQSRSEYLDQFMDGNIDLHLLKWNKLN